ncbi:SDR family oxidoreductase [Nocardia mexicana]|uniref:NAD(P)-dependent dehydrogenase (Short-subunit alcohol dehydrogenase family) n=1 Tax=Nocardia mexicana TaxID=279262 RepID=A0A370GNG1_9NOCA|nr:NAD(P)-dependent oxidoreductase [Nocardia mexicana]RDI45111.1 NAD(P)-dependent dehydrogenase (short-subunit alcohol dehydrogenase family) [Nocardia mexicana]
MSDQHRPLTDRTMVISGASRGIGLAIAVAAARQGANVVLLAKTADPHPRLPGTVHTAAAEVEAAGGRAAAVVGDVREEADVRRVVDTAVERFGGVDLCVNNAGAIVTEPTEQLSAKKFDLMQDINIRGTFLLTRACLPHLREAADPHVLTISPPVNMNPRWLGAHPAYTLSKYGMTLLSQGWSIEFADAGIAFNCLWPQTFIATSAVAHLPDGERQLAAARSPQIMADAALAILTQPARRVTGNCFLDADALSHYAGIDDLSPYGGGENPTPDLFLD